MSKRAREFSCYNNPDDFCYVCGEYVIDKKKHTFTDSLQQKYEQYFGVAPASVDQRWTPSMICHSCQSILTEWASTCKYVFIDDYYEYIMHYSDFFLTDDT